MILFGYEVNTDDRVTTVCYYDTRYHETKWMATWGRVSLKQNSFQKIIMINLVIIKIKAHLILYSAVPFVVLVFSNFSLMGK